MNPAQRHHLGSAVVFAFVCGLLAVMPQVRGADTAASPSDSEENAFRVGTRAYLYGLPMVSMYLKRQEELKHASVNQFHHIKDIVTSDRGLVLPNTEVLYSIAWLDLRNGPIVLTLPDAKERYFSFQTVNFFTDNGFYASSRTKAAKKQLAFVGPGWLGKLPADMQRLDCGTPAMAIIGRTFVAGPADLEAARQLQSEYQIAPLPTATGVVAKIEYPTLTMDDPLNFFTILDQAIRENKPAFAEGREISSFTSIGIGQVIPFDVSTLDPEVRSGLTRAVAEGKRLIQEYLPQLQIPINGWVIPPTNVGRYGTNYLMRAAATTTRLALHSPRECSYLISSVDQDNKPLQSDQRYILRFDKDQVPPTRQFWSVTMYRMPERKLPDGTAGRVSFHSLDKQLHQGSDGSIEFLVQPEAPGESQTTNWLPTPGGPFCLMLRLYDPSMEVIRREWAPPAIRRQP